jgi:phytoene synthase
MNDAVTALVRRHDPDRFLTALFAPPEKRAALLVLYAFNHELARAREVAREPALALIRLQWWREVVEGAARRHEVATPLSAALTGGALARDDLLAMIAAREAAAEGPIERLADWRDYVFGAAGCVAVAAARLLGAPEPELFRVYGAAYGAAGILRSAAAPGPSDGWLLPADLRAEHSAGLAAASVRPGMGGAASGTAVLAAEVSGWLAAAPRRIVPRSAIAAALPAVLARRDLGRLHEPPRGRGLADRLAVVLGGVRAVI